jgi:anti-sigma factor RsiW
MKPCSRNRKLLALLAVDELDLAKAQTMRGHIEECEGCRFYYQSMARVYSGQRAIVEKLPEVEASFGLHQAVMAKIRRTNGRSSDATPSTLNWIRIGAVAASLVLLVFCAMMFSRQKQEKPLARHEVTRPAPETKGPKEFQPSIAGYRKNAGKSFENLDALLNKEGGRNPGNGESLDISTLFQ